MSSPITLLVFDKNRSHRKKVCQFFEGEDDFVVVLGTGNPSDAKKCVRNFFIQMSVVNLDGLGVPQKTWDVFLKELGTESRTLVLSKFFRSRLMFSGMQGVLSGYLSATLPLTELAVAIRRINEIKEKTFLVQGMWGEGPYKRVTQGSINGRTDLNNNIDNEIRELDFLTPQERRIMELLKSGLRNKEISVKLNICENTVKCHVYKLFKKLNIHKRKQLLMEV